MPSQSRVRAARARAGHPLLRRANWIELAKFACVGASGYVVNLTIYTTLLRRAGWNYASAATVAFLVAVTNNYLWNRLWTFRRQRGHLGAQGLRFFLVATAAYGANLGILSALIALGTNKVLAQAIAVVLVTPLNFIGNKLWSFRATHDPARARPASRPRPRPPTRRRPPNGGPRGTRRDRC